MQFLKELSQLSSITVLKTKWLLGTMFKHGESPCTAQCLHATFTENDADLENEKLLVTASLAVHLNEGKFCQRLIQRRYDNVILASRWLSRLTNS